MPEIKLAGIVMSVIIHDVQQNTDEWLKLRLGKFTGSRIPKLFMGKSTKGYNELINEIAYERLTGKVIAHFSNKWTDRGHELEALAIEEYENNTFNKVTRVGFVELNKDVGVSPDGHIGEHGMIQVKAYDFTHMCEFHFSGKISKNEELQCQAEMYGSQRQWNILYIYHPQLKPYQFKILRNKETITAIKREIELAKIEVVKRMEALKGIVR